MSKDNHPIQPLLDRDILKVLAVDIKQFILTTLNPVRRSESIYSTVLNISTQNTNFLLVYFLF